MKKLSLLFFAVCASVMSWAADGLLQANPFAYDLKSEIIESGTKLKLTYSLNANAVTSDTYNNNHGLQIYLIDENGNRIKNDAGTANWACTSGAYTKGTHSVTIPVIDLPSAAKGKPILWEVVVHGNKNRTKPKMVDDYYPVAADTPKDTYKPRAGHGIAVDKDPQSKWFGRIFVAEACTTTTGKNSLLEYDMLLNYKGYHHKDKYDYGATSEFNSTTNYEPHRVKISDDGRMFVTCYSPTATAAVLEYLGGGVFRKIVRADESKNKDTDGSLTDYPANKKYNRRPIAMDVRGSGENLNIIVAWVVPKGRKRNNQWETKIEVYEYKVGKRSDDIANNQGLDQDDGTLVATYIEANPNNTSAGYLFQGYCNGHNCTNHAFVGLAYGGNDTYPIWMKVDFGFGTNDDFRAQILNFTSSKKTIDYKDDSNSGNVYRMPTNTTYRSSGGYYGGAGLYVKGNQLFTGSGNNAMLRYTINDDNSLTYRESTGMGSPGTSTWLDAFAEDYAGNLYCVSEAADNIVVVAMPYDGTRKTRASASQSFTISDPVPNIYATNLRYEAVEGAPKYKFSFNVNTKPKYAEIRFYKSYESMKKSLSVVNADDFKEGKDKRDADLYCYYPIPNTQLKSGKIELEFGMVGGVIQNKLLTNQSLPRGELYWSVYVETDKSSAFAPIYRQPLTGNDAHYHMHAIVNNNPETDQFGAIYGAQEDKRGSTAKQSLMIYEISDNGSDVHNINNTTRYTKKQEYLYNTSDAVYNAKPRRMDIAPNGTLYIAHEGADNQTSADQVASWQYGGIYAWNPNDPLKNGKLKLSKFSGNKIGTSSAVVLYGHVNNKDTTWKMYAANSYGEFTTHGNNYTNDNQRGKFGWNGFVEYEKAKATNWSSWLNVANANHEYQLKQGDGSGNSSLVAMDKGVWICQYREHSIAIKVAMNEVFADNRGSLVLSFVPYGNYTNADADWGPRTWRSSTTDGGRTRDENGNLTVKDDKDKSLLTQVDGALLQATPGAGMAYRKINGVDYLFINNHDGNIVQLQVDWDANSSPAKPLVHVSKAKVLTTPSDVKGILTINGDTQKNIRWKTAAVSSMSFDFAGNLVTTTGVSYFMLSVPQLLSGGQDKFNTPEGGQSIIIYTMPYDRTNAREVQAPKSNIFIPERLAQLNMTDEDIQKILTEHNDHGSQCYIDLYRPMQGGMFNTFCVPFELNTTSIPTDHPLYGAEIRRFTGVTLSESGGEKILTLNFENLINNTMAANVPHIINPKSNIKSIIPFDWLQVLAKNTTVVSPYFNFDNGNRITYQGILPKTQVDALYDPTTKLPLRLILVADNRLAVLTGDGEMYGFRGYFDLAKPLPPGTVAKISAKKDTPTNTTIVVDGKKVNIDKYLREGRVYIRVGDSLYTVDGQLVK